MTYLKRRGNMKVNISNTIFCNYKVLDIMRHHGPSLPHDIKLEKARKSSILSQKTLKNAPTHAKATIPHIPMLHSNIPRQITQIAGCSARVPSYLARKSSSQSGKSSISKSSSSTNLHAKASDQAGISS